MNDNKICNNCGAKLSANGYCIRCGYNNIDNRELTEQDYGEKGLTSKEKRKIILSFLNFIFFFPTIFGFVVAWVLFGTLSKNVFDYFFTLIIGGIYVFISLLSFLSSLSLLIKKSRKQK